MTRDPAEGSPLPGRVGSFLLLGVGTGLVLGATRLGVFIILRHRSGLTLEPFQSLLFFEPLSATIALGLVAVILAAVAHQWPRLVHWKTLAWAACALSAFALLQFTPRIARPAAAILALGAGYQASRILDRYRPQIEYLLRRVVPVGLFCLTLAAINLWAGKRWRESRTLGALPPAAADAPNVLLIILDTVRAWDLSVYGYARPTTPTLQDLSRKGVLFTRAVSPAPWTLPSHASMFTGRWPHELSTGWRTPLDDAFPTVAELFSRKGYVTLGIVGNVNYAGSSTGLARGFARYVDYDTSPTHVLNVGLLELAWRLVGPKPAYPPSQADEKHRDAEEIVATFTAWLTARDRISPARPFFAFLNFFDAHRPYTSPVDFQRRFSTPGVLRQANLQPRKGPQRPWDVQAIQGSRDAYDASIAYIDAQLGVLLSDLEARGILDNTIVVITADHGEEFAEHGVIGHGNSLNRAVVMVPLLIYSPGRAPAGMRVGDPVSTRELAATLVGMAGADSAAQLPGPSLTRFWQGAAPPANPPSVQLSEVDLSANLPDWYPVMHGPIRSMVSGRWRYLHSGTGGESLFDFDADSLELHDLIATDSGRVIAPILRARLDSLTVPSTRPVRPR